MNANDALGTLIAHVDTSDKAIHLNWHETQQWEKGTVESFLELGLLTQGTNAMVIECQGCDNRCFEDVILVGEDEKQRAFVACSDPDMQSQVGRVQVALEELQQWQSSAKMLANVIAGLLGIHAEVKYQVQAAYYKLGMLKGEGGAALGFFTRSAINT